MPFFPRLDQIFAGAEPYAFLIELGVIWVCVYLIVRFLRGTRGAGILKGFVFLLIVVTLLLRVVWGGSDAFDRLNFIYDHFMGLIALLLIVVFQPELRQAMIRLGHARFLRLRDQEVKQVVDAVTEAVGLLSKSQFGALIAIERGVGLGGMVEGGVRLDAEVSARLLQAIFWPNSPLHDLGVVISRGRVLAASVQFPLAEEGVAPKDWGSRHRAALGLTMDSDCLVVVVSEETGAISIAENGRMERDLSPDEVAARLRLRLGEAALPGPAAAADVAPDPPTAVTEAEARASA